MAKIKIIDDDVEFAENLSVLLRARGHDVSCLSETENADEIAVRDGAELVILDVMFPGNPHGGFDLARQIRRKKESKELPIIMLTAVNQEYPLDFSAADIDSDWMPVQGFLEKPVQPQQMFSLIERLLKPTLRK